MYASFQSPVHNANGIFSSDRFIPRSTQGHSFNGLSDIRSIESVCSNELLARFIGIGGGMMQPRSTRISRAFERRCRFLCETSIDKAARVFLSPLDHRRVSRVQSIDTVSHSASSIRVRFRPWNARNRFYLLFFSCFSLGFFFVFFVFFFLHIALQILSPSVAQ